MDFSGSGRTGNASGNTKKVWSRSLDDALCSYNIAGDVRKPVPETTYKRGHKEDTTSLFERSPPYAGHIDRAYQWHTSTWLGAPLYLQIKTSWCQTGVAVDAMVFAAVLGDVTEIRTHPSAIDGGTGPKTSPNSSTQTARSQCQSCILFFITSYQVLQLLHAHWPASAGDLASRLSKVASVPPAFLAVVQDTHTAILNNRRHFFIVQKALYSTLTEGVLRACILVQFRHKFSI